VLGQLGHGGQADVFRAVHPTLPIEVPIKLTHATLEPKVRDALREEAHILCDLDHPHIARVRDFDFVDGRFFMVLDFIRGSSTPAVASVSAVPESLIKRFDLIQIGNSDDRAEFSGSLLEYRPPREHDDVQVRSDPFETRLPAEQQASHRRDSFDQHQHLFAGTHRDAVAGSRVVRSTGKKSQSQIDATQPSLESRRVFTIDDTTITLAPEPKLQKAFPPASNQYDKEGRTGGK